MHEPDEFILPVNRASLEASKRQFTPQPPHGPIVEQESDRPPPSPVEPLSHDRPDTGHDVAD